MSRWAIYLGSRELARELNDPLLGIVNADSKEAAEAVAAKTGEIVSKAVAGGGLWAVKIRDNNRAECPEREV